MAGAAPRGNGKREQTRCGGCPVGIASGRLSTRGSHGSAFLRAAAARLGACVAVVVIVVAALLGAPVADLGAELTDLCSELVIARCGIGAERADRRARHAAVRTVVVAVFIDHLAETVLARGGARVAGVDTRLMLEVGGGCRRLPIGPSADAPHRGWRTASR